MNRNEQVMSGIWDLFSKRMWLDGLKMKARFKGYHPSEIHCIEYIGKNVDCNVTKLADSFYMTRSAISKLTKKLMEKNLIESYQKPNNRKEIYFRLTGLGTAVNEGHEELHKEYRQRDSAVFEQLTEEQFDSILRFTEAYNRHLDAEIEKLGYNDRSGYYDRL